MARTNKLLVPGAEQVLDQFKYEIAQEFGVQLGSDSVARSNGSVGGGMYLFVIMPIQLSLCLLYKSFCHFPAYRSV